MRKEVAALITSIILIVGFAYVYYEAKSENEALREENQELMEETIVKGDYIKQLQARLESEAMMEEAEW